MSVIGGAAADGAEFGNGQLVLGQHLEQEGVEGLVGAVELVDQQHRRARPASAPAAAAARSASSREYRLCEALALAVGRRAPPRPGGSRSSAAPRSIRRRSARCPGLRSTARAAAACSSARRQRLGQLGLADARLALEEQRALQLQAQEQRGGRAAGRRRSSPSASSSMTASTESGSGRRHGHGRMDAAGRRPGRRTASAGPRRAGERPAAEARSAQRASAFSTARAAITLIIAARYAAEPCRSLFMSVADTFTALAAAGVKLFVSAASICVGAEHAALGAGDRHAHAARALADEHADQREARGRLLVLDVGRLLRRSGS